jgi:hypothetical protein
MPWAAPGFHWQPRPTGKTSSVPNRRRWGPGLDAWSQDPQPAQRRLTGARGQQPGRYSQARRSRQQPTALEVGGLRVEGRVRVVDDRHGEFTSSLRPWTLLVTGFPCSSITGDADLGGSIPAMVCAQRVSINPLDAHALLNGTQQWSGRFVRVDIENGQIDRAARSTPASRGGTGIHASQCTEAHCRACCKSSAMISGAFSGGWARGARR